MMRSAQSAGDGGLSDFVRAMSIKRCLDGVVLSGYNSKPHFVMG